MILICVNVPAVLPAKLLFVGLLQTLNGDGLQPGSPAAIGPSHKGGRHMVAHASTPDAIGKSTAHSAFQMYFGGLEVLGQAYDPFLKGVARTQIEMLGFFNRRAQAYMQMPGRLAYCRTPQDLLTAQLQFWRSAYDDYVESASRVTHALTSLGTPNVAALATEGAQAAHDYIAFPEPNVPEEAPRQHRERKAA